MEFIIFAVVAFVLYKLFFPAKQDKTVHKHNSNTNDDDNRVVSRSAEPYEGDFATFTIHTNHTREPERTTNRVEGHWVPEGQSKNIKGRIISRGFFYFGGVLSTVEGYGIEPSLVDEQRSASGPIQLDGKSDIFEDETLGYWPSYASISTVCRGVYLDWLASERANPKTPIGYVFIYFYGLERRVIENRANSSVSDEEFLSIFNEVVRLNATFYESRSFRGYSTNFLELMALLRPHVLQHRIKDIPKAKSSILFKVELARAVKEQRPINAGLALNWLKYTEFYSLKMPARRCEEEFKSLFTRRFDAKFKNGFFVKPNKTRLKVTYQAASRSIWATNVDLEDLPDPSILKSSLNKLTPLADSCTEELKGLSRYLGKADTSINDVAAQVLLPREIADESSSPLIESVGLWAQQVIANNEGLTTVKEFWSQIGVPMPSAINKKENELILSIASRAGIGIAPDFKLHNAKAKVDGYLVLFPSSNEENLKPSTDFIYATITLRLGAMVATINGRVENSQKAVLRSMIEQDAKLSSAEKKSLLAYLTWRLNTPASSAGLKARIALLNSEQITFIKRFIISIALADGNIDTSELKQIEKIYTSLGLDSLTVASDVHNFASRKDPYQEDPNEKEENFVLDEEALALHENATTDAKAMLEGIFTLAGAEEETVINESAFGQELDLAHAELFTKLVSKELWSRDELQELCTKLHLMVDGAIETINDWAYEKVDAPVLDEDGDVYVDLEIVEELKG